MRYEDLLEFLDDYGACGESLDWLDNYRAEHPQTSVAAIFDAVPRAPWRVWLHQVLGVPCTQTQAAVALKALDAFLAGSKNPDYPQGARKEAQNAYDCAYWDDTVDWACYIATEDYTETSCPELATLNDVLQADCPGETLVEYVKGRQ